MVHSLYDDFTSTVLYDKSYAIFYKNSSVIISSEKGNKKFDDIDSLQKAKKISLF